MFAARPWVGFLLFFGDVLSAGACSQRQQTSVLEIHGLKQGVPAGNAINGNDDVVRGIFFSKDWTPRTIL
jgi:hypothetical protein